MKTVFLSAFNSGLDFQQNLTAHRQLREVLYDRMLLLGQVSNVFGRYNGTDELSFRVSNLDDDAANILAEVAFKEFYQESILVVESDGSAYLRYQNGYIKPLGIMTQVDSVEGLDAYSEVDDKFYTVK